MVFNSTGDSQGIVQDVLFTIFGNSSTNAQYPVADITRNVNRWYDKIVGQIMEADGRWEFDDTNYTDLPIGSTNLVLNQQDYTIDTSYLKILRVEITDSTGNTKKLIPIDEADVVDQSLPSFMSAAGTPNWYDVSGNSIFLYPKPNYNSTGGLTVYFQRNVSYFTASDTTKQPGFASIFHRLLSLGAAYDFLVTRASPQVEVIRNEISTLEQALLSFYSKRDKDDKIKFRVKKTIWR